jgi:hypothetical protein
VGRVISVDPRKYSLSQTDPVGELRRKKTLSERIHVLPDGRGIGREQTAAWVMWSIGQQILGVERRNGEEQAGFTKTKIDARAA